MRLVVLTFTSSRRQHHQNGFPLDEFPIWSLVSILVAVLVIYGLAVYGGRDA